MTSIEDLNLTSIDGMRHLTVGEGIVAAVVFAAKNGHSTQTAYRFVTAVVMVDTLNGVTQWEYILRRIRVLEREGD